MLEIGSDTGPPKPAPKLEQNCPQKQSQPITKLDRKVFKVDQKSAYRSTALI